MDDGSNGREGNRRITHSSSVSKCGMFGIVLHITALLDSSLFQKTRHRSQSFCTVKRSLCGISLHRVEQLTRSQHAGPPIKPSEMISLARIKFVTSPETSPLRPLASGFTSRWYEQVGKMRRNSSSGSVGVTRWSLAINVARFCKEQN